ncbi:glycosyl hydrolase [Sphingomonas hengshuiensis]|nr:glycosyl hydrolase [Sphingomonas hengshuiensis]
MSCMPLAASTARATPTPALSNPAASPGARALYRYIAGLRGRQTLTGQMESTWDGGPRSELDYIRKCSGKLPALLGLDYIDPADNDHVNDRASRWYLEEGGIATLCWHWGAPDIGPGYENAKKPFDAVAALVPGTPQHRVMLRDMDAIADKLAVLQRRGVPILWRPFHEFTGTWFWWGQHGPAVFRQLWQCMYRHFTVTRGLDNLIWVLGYSHEPDKAYDPGRAFYDIAGADAYVDDHGPLKSLYDRVVAITGPDIPIALHENGPIPDPEQMRASGADWCYFMTWHTKYIKDPAINPPALIRAAYRSPRYATLSDVRRDLPRRR